MLEKRARQTARDSRNITGAVSVENMQRQYKLQRMDELLAKQPNTPANNALRNRLRILDAFGLQDGRVVRWLPNARASTAVFKFERAA